jgi:two-component system response regulator NreC
MENAIRLMLVDDHDVVRTGLRSYLEQQSGIQVVAEARNGNEALERAQQTQPDVIVMDITMPEMDGLAATRRLKEILPTIQILALTVHEDKQYFFEMMAAGASGYITKQSAAEDLVAAIHAVAEGHIYLQPVLARWLLEDYQRLSVGSPSEERINGEKQAQDRVGGQFLLSKREIQVLEMVAEGFTNHEISEKLEISPKTVARHRERIMHKLNIHSSTELVKYAIRTGLVQP